VPGRILQDDIDEVRQRARIDDVVSGWVTLRRAGAGSLSGLCPFHDEKTPSFTVTPARGLFYCFGCGRGGDVFTFVREINNFSFAEAAEFLATKYGLQLRYDDSGRPAGPATNRVRLVEANAAAADFYAAALRSPEAVAGRQFLTGRGFDQASAEHFGVGFAPRDGRALTNHLRQRGFSEEELITAGLTRRGGWDYFQSRLLWPIRDAGRTVLGFGARRLFDDDRLPAKYINTPETPIYKKSHVLYGLDLARSAIGKQQRAVIVEGYTDVMACHLAGIEVAVASCGTAFGDDHARLVQRLMGGDAFHGEVIFTFDGDAAGQNAALKVFAGDAHFAAQTYVAVEPGGLDPCDLRLQQGDAALRELIGSRVPLYRFVMRNVLSKYDLDRVDARIGAVREAAGLIISVRDHSLREGYLRELASLAGLDVDEVRRIVSQASRQRRSGGAGSRSGPAPASGRNTPGSSQLAGSSRPSGSPRSTASSHPSGSFHPSNSSHPNASSQPGTSPHSSASSHPTSSFQPNASSHPSGSSQPNPGAAPYPGPASDNPTDPASMTAETSPEPQLAFPLPSADDRDLSVERDTLKLMVQHPALFAATPPWNGVTPDDFSAPAYQAVYQAITATASEPAATWSQRVLVALPDGLRQWAIQLAVEPVAGDPDPTYVQEYTAKLQLLALQRQISQLKSTMQRTNPLTNEANYRTMFETMVTLELRRKELQQLSLGDSF
jgi:DNA primase